MARTARRARTADFFGRRGKVRTIPSAAAEQATAVDIASKLMAYNLLETWSKSLEQKRAGGRRAGHWGPTICGGPSGERYVGLDGGGLSLDSRLPAAAADPTGFVANPCPVSPIHAQSGQNVPASLGGSARKENGEPALQPAWLTISTPAARTVKRQSARGDGTCCWIRRCANSTRRRRNRLAG